MPDVRSRPEPSSPRRVLTKEFHLGPTELAEGSRAGLASSSVGLKVGSGRHAGHVLSPVLKSDILFDYVGLFWSGLYPEDSSVAFRVRTSTDGRNWGPWETVQVEMPPGPLAEYDTYGALIWTDRAKFVQFLGELRGDGKKPTLRRVGLTLLNPYDGPPLETASETGDDGFAGSALAAEADLDIEANATPAVVSGKPITFKREDWGADESLRFSGGQEIWPRSHVPTKKLIVHHTVTSNGYATVEQAKAQVRAIYTYHARSLGWGDIGYNSLIDRFGNSYEGRRGRNGPSYDGPGGREILSEDVVAGHALAYNYGSSGIALLGTFTSVSPSSSALAKLRDVLAWECSRHGINPQAVSDFLLHSGSWHRDLRNLVGHRDVGVTSCPGGAVYALLSTLRSDVAARLGSAGPSVSITSAPAEGTISKGEVEYTWKGSGGSGGLKYSYCLEGWSKISGSSEVNYLRGFSSRNSLIWSPWTQDTKARLCYVAGGIYTFHVKVKDSQGRVSIYHKTRSFRGIAPSKICNGALLKGSGDEVYVMRSGLKRHVPNAATFEAYGHLWGNVNHIPDSSLAGIPTGEPLLDALADGNLVKGTGDEVYAMEGGLKRHVSSPSVLADCGYGLDAVYVISDSRLSGIPTGAALSGPPCPHLSPPSGVLIKGGGDEVYVMRGGLKRHVPNAATFEAYGYLWGNVNHIPDSSLGGIPTGEPLLDALADGNLVKGTGDEVYAMEGGLKRHVSSPSVLADCGYGLDAVYVISDSRLSGIPTGAALSGPPCPHLSPPSGVLVKGSGDEVYVMRGGLKRHVPNAATFEAYGYLWGNVNHIPDSSLGGIPTGEPLLDALADGNLVKGTGDEVYAMEGGLKRHVVSRSVMASCGYGWDAVYVVSDSRLRTIATGSSISGPPCPHLSPPDGTLLRGSGDPIYVMEDGLRRHILNAEVFTACGYLLGDVNLIADGSLASIPRGDDLTGEPCP